MELLYIWMQPYNIYLAYKWIAGNIIQRLSEVQFVHSVADRDVMVTLNQYQRQEHCNLGYAQYSTQLGIGSRVTQHLESRYTLKATQLDNEASKVVLIASG